MYNNGPIHIAVIVEQLTEHVFAKTNILVHLIKHNVVMSGFLG